MGGLASARLLESKNSIESSLNEQHFEKKINFLGQSTSWLPLITDHKYTFHTLGYIQHTIFHYIIE